MTGPYFDAYRARTVESDSRHEAAVDGYDGDWAGEEAVPDNPDWASMTPAEIVAHEFSYRDPGEGV